MDLLRLPEGSPAVLRQRPDPSSSWSQHLERTLAHHNPPPSADPIRISLSNWQVSRTWARLIREAEGLWRVDVRAMHRIAAQELMALISEVPPRLRQRVNRWLARFGVTTRLNHGDRVDEHR